MAAGYGIIAMMLCGVIFGALAANFVDESAHTSIRSYLDGFFGTFDKNNIEFKTTLIDSLYKYARVIAVLWISGFFGPGLVMIAGVVLFKSFAYGFTTAALVRYYGFYGFVVGFNCYIPQNMFFLPAMVYVSYSAVKRICVKTLDKRRGAAAGSEGIGEYCAVLLIGILCCAISALTETCLTPILIEYIW